MAGRIARYRQLLDDRTFAAFFASFVLGEAGYAVYAVGVLWLALTVSGSPLIAGIVLAVEFGIYALSFTAGPFVDRARDLRTILLVGYPIQGVLATALGVLALLDRLTVPLLLGLIVALSIAWDFTWTALNAIPPRVVPTDRLFLANGLLGAAAGGNQLAGFAGGAALILVVGSPGAAMLLYGALNFGAAVLALPVRAPSAARAPTRFWDEMADGWRYLFRTRDPPLLSLTAYSAFEGFFSAAAPLLITVLAYRSFAAPSRSYAVLFTAFAVGAIAGSLVLGEIAPRRRIGATLAAATAAEGILILVAIAAVPVLVWSIPAWAAVGFAGVAFYETLVVFLQATTPTALLGRTLTNTYLFRGGARAAGALVVGALLTVLAPGTIGLVLVTSYLIIAFAVPMALPGLARLRF
ncbi:MAG: MFS transporter [Thermoplasmata archaeon]|nr:MFS transporter [Thermoplasmata archaeon]MCI4353740.1 MFS transporter [Thermoplasmata archaeon]